MRKKPVQQRSQQVVEALIQAAAQEIARNGIEHLTTVQVAARAGVSIGSLYQYFANKEQLLAALLDRLSGELGAMVTRTVPPLLDADIRTIVRGLLVGALDFIGSDQGLYLELLRNWYRLDIGKSLHRFERHMLEVTGTYAMAHAADLKLDNLPARNFVVLNSVVFTLLRYLSLPRSALFTRTQLVDELTEMIARYLENPRSRTRRRPRRVP